MLTVTVNITDEIKLVNNGYNNKIIDDSNNNIIEEFTDTLNNALTYATKKYDIN